jgi:TnpA family transposase
MEIEKNYVDSHGQREVAFAFCRLLGFHFILYGRGGEIATNRVEDQEIIVLTLHLLQVSLVYINTLKPTCEKANGPKPQKSAVSNVLGL